MKTELIMTILKAAAGIALGLIIAVQKPPVGMTVEGMQALGIVGSLGCYLVGICSCTRIYYSYVNGYSIRAVQVGGVSASLCYFFRQYHVAVDECPGVGSRRN